jgi:S1/P1 Nuclease
MNARVIAVALTVSLLSLGSSHAWDGDGHRVVGSIADQLLKPVAKAKVAALLGFSLRIAGPWADCVKSVQRVSDTTFKYTHSAQFGAPCVPFEAPAAAEEQARMENFVQRNWMLCRYRDYTSSCDNTYHFTDVPIQRSEYSRIHAGTNDRDIVQTINAAIAKLRGQPLQAPVSIGDQKEALVLLAHLVGDLHQPLHVDAIYLDAAGGRIDFPDGSTPSDRNDTHGGNLLFDQDKVFHTEWDSIPSDLGDDASANADMLARARQVPATQGLVEELAAKWATDTVQLAEVVFQGVSFRPKSAASDRSPCWDIDLPANYWTTHDETKRRQLATAGAHLAELLNAIWP